MENHQSTLKENFTLEHYRLLAGDYDYFHMERFNVLIPALVEKLELKSDHILADIGSGTGFISEGLFRSSHLENPVWCIEPCREMHEQAIKREGVYPLNTNAETFFQNANRHGCFDRVIAIESAHHFANQLDVFTAIERSLRPGGIFILTSVRSDTDNPLFKRAAEVLEASASKETEEATLKLLQEAKFEVEPFVFRRFSRVSKGKWYDMLRGRLYSCFRDITDEEMEMGIMELEEGKLKHVRDDEAFEMCLAERFFIAKKQK